MPVFDLPQCVAESLASERTESPVATDDTSSVTSSEESFERVSSADLADYETADTEAKPAAAEPMPDHTDPESATLDPPSVDVQTDSSDDAPHQ